MSLFEKACREDFSEKLGRGVGGVTFEYDQGYACSSYTYEDPSFIIRVWDTEERYYIESYENSTAGEFLTEMFSWEGSK